MPHLDDYQLERTPEPDGQGQQEGSGLWIVIVAAVAVLAAAIGYYYWQREPSVQVKTDTVSPQASTPQAAPRGAGEPGEAIDLPPLDETDSVVRQLVRNLSSHPTVAAWLATDGLIRNFTAVVVNVSRGQTPERHLRRLAPQAPFLTQGPEGAITVDPRSYARYDQHADAVAGLDARGAARLYATLKPRIDEAYRQLGEPEPDFDLVLERAIVELLRTPIVRDPVPLTPKPVFYAYADDRLESLSHAQKQLLRMGPDNVRLIQDKLREIAGHLGIPEANLPRPPA